MCFASLASLYDPRGIGENLTAVEKRLVSKFVAKSIDCTGHFMCLEKVLATDSAAIQHQLILTLLVYQEKL